MASLTSDLSSGFYVFLLALPLSLGIAEASGFPAIMGLVTATVGGLLVSWIMGAKFTIKGPAAGLIVIVLGSVNEMGGENHMLGWQWTLGAIFISGIVQVIFGLLKWGDYINKIPPSAIQGILAAIGVVILSKQLYILMGIPAFDGMEALVEELGTAYVQRAPYRTALFDGAIEVCGALKARGHRMFILTNGFEEVQHIKVNRSGLEPFFDGVFTSDALGFKKPHPTCFAKGLTLADSRAERAVMIGDDWECDVDGALQAGWGAVHFDPHQPPNLSTTPRRINALRTLLELNFNQR